MLTRIFQNGSGDLIFINLFTKIISYLLRSHESIYLYCFSLKYHRNNNKNIFFFYRNYFGGLEKDRLISIDDADDGGG
jgi:hypothetical protein